MPMHEIAEIKSDFEVSRDKTNRGCHSSCEPVLNYCRSNVFAGLPSKLQPISFRTFPPFRRRSIKPSTSRSVFRSFDKCAQVQVCWILARQYLPAASAATAAGLLIPVPSTASTIRLPTSRVMLSAAVACLRLVSSRNHRQRKFG